MKQDRLWRQRVCGLGFGLFSAIGLLAFSGNDAHAQLTTLEMQTIAEGEDECALDTDYYVVPEALNDLSTFNSSSPRPYDYIDDQGGSFVVRPDLGLFQPARVALTAPNLVSAGLSWQGPYVDYQLDRTQTAATPYDLGAPLDFWGSPYYMFSPLGLLRGDTGTVTLELYADNFDTYALVSLGPDGVMSNDDIVYTFGGGITTFRLSSVRGTSGVLATTDSPASASSNFSVAAGSTATLRGSNLGSSASGATVIFGSVDLTSEVVSWSSREVKVTIPSVLSGTSGAISIHRGAAVTNGINLSVTSAAAAARDWALFE